MHGLHMMHGLHGLHMLHGLQFAYVCYIDVVEACGPILLEKIGHEVWHTFNFGHL